MSVPNIEPCKCGRQPEQNVSLRGYTFSLSCMCGEEQINYLEVMAQKEGANKSEYLRKLIDNDKKNNNICLFILNFSNTGIITGTIFPGSVDRYDEVFARSGKGKT